MFVLIRIANVALVGEIYIYRFFPYFSCDLNMYNTGTVAWTFLVRVSDIQALYL